VTEIDRCVLVVWSGCIAPVTGGGQRTAIFFSALKKVAPTEVVVVGFDLRREEIEQYFPGHAGLHLIQSGRLAYRRLHRFQLLFDRLRRYLWIQHEYRPDPDMRACIAEITRDKASVLLYRFFLPFCLAGHAERQSKDSWICVDVDDRDDQKLLVNVQQTFSNPAVLGLYRQTIVPMLRRLMRKRLAAADLVLLAAGEDLDMMAGLPVSVVPNAPFSEPAGQYGASPSARRDVLFVGSLTFRPNLIGLRWFLTHCWPVLHERYPASRFRIVGSGDWSQLSREFPNVENVDIVGRVDDLAAEYDRARLVVAPIFVGGGSKIKVIESCSFGRPPVVTSHSVRGFGPEMAELLPQSDTVEGYIAECSRYLADDEAVDSLAQKLYDLQRAKFSRSAIEDQIAGEVTAMAERKALEVHGRKS